VKEQVWRSVHSFYLLQDFTNRSRKMVVTNPLKEIAREETVPVDRMISRGYRREKNDDSKS